MLYVNYNRSYKALNQYIREYNSDKEKVADRIKSSVVHTAKEIIRIYGAFLLKANNNQELDKNNVDGLVTNNVQLATLTHTCRRTIQRHIKILQSAGLITEKKNHGSNSGYELWVNVDILLINYEPSVEKVKKELDEALKRHAERDRELDSCNDGMTNLRDTDTGNNSYINNILIGGDKLEDSTPDPGLTGNEKIRCSLSLTDSLNLTGNTLTGNTGNQVRGENFEDAGNQADQDGASQNGDTSSEVADPILRQSLDFYVSLLWTVARNTLYKGVFLTDWQVENVKILLYKWYEPVKQGKLSGVHQKYIERIFLVRKFIDKDPENRYVQLPHKYFDTENPNGFTGTKKWLILHRVKQKEVQEKLILHAQIRKYQNNLKKDTAKQIPLLQVYRECEQRIGKLKKPYLLHQFYASVLEPEINNQIQNKNILASC